MSVWLLVITLSFSFVNRDMTLELPPETIYRSPERCAQAGRAIAASLTQDGTRVTWKCVHIDQ